MKPNHLSLTVFAIVILFIVGCGASGGSKMENLDGTWENPANHEKVVINLAGEKKTIAIADKTLPISITTAKEDRFVLHVSDTASGEKDWELFRVWNDNGSSFTLNFEHDGQRETLVRVKG